MKTNIKKKCLVVYAHDTNAAAFVAEFSDEEILKTIEQVGVKMNIIDLSNMKEASLIFDGVNADKTHKHCIKFSKVAKLSVNNIKALAALNK